MECFWETAGRMTMIRNTILGPLRKIFFLARSSLLGIDINRSWNSPVCGFVNELHCLREQINAVNEVRSN